MRAALPLLVFIGIVIFLAIGLEHDPNILPSPLIGKAAPEFELPLLQSPQRMLGSKDLAGQAYALNVWGSWCPACYDEHNVLLEIAQQGEIKLIGLNWKDQKEDALNWIRSLGDPYEAIAFDSVGDVGINWGVYGAPETFLVDAQGIVIYKHIGPMTLDIWQREFVSRVKP